MLYGVRFLGDLSDEVTPVPIPNTAVKPFSADDTAWVTVWESRSSPDYFIKAFAFYDGGFFIGARS